MIEPINLARGLQQGDIVRSKSAVLWNRLGIVVTADCDISNNKHWGRISLVPIESASTLCSTLLARAWIDRQKDALLDRFRAIYSKGADLISKEHARLLISSGVRSVPPECLDIADALSVLESSDEPSDLLEVVVRCNTLLPKPVDLKKWFATKISGLPEDLMPIPLQKAWEVPVGVAWLRSLREVKFGDIVSTSRDWVDETWIRVARLGPQYRYRLTQKLASVFSDIGLPGEVENDCKVALDAEIKEILKDQ